MTRNKKALLGLVALIGVILIGTAVLSATVNGGDDLASVSRPTARPSTTTVTVTVPEPVTITVTEPLPAPKIAFSDGVYLVGADVEPGNYRSDQPTSTHCYWARLTDPSGLNIIANQLTQGAARLTVVAGEYLEVSGCSFYRA